MNENEKSIDAKLDHLNNDPLNSRRFPEIMGGFVRGLTDLTTPAEPFIPELREARHWFNEMYEKRFPYKVGRVIGNVVVVSTVLGGALAGYYLNY